MAKMLLIDGNKYLFIYLSIYLSIYNRLYHTFMSYMLQLCDNITISYIDFIYFYVISGLDFRILLCEDVKAFGTSRLPIK